MIRYIELFAGVGGFRYGLERVDPIKSEEDDRQADIAHEGSPDGFEHSVQERRQPDSSCISGGKDEASNNIEFRTSGATDCDSSQNSTGVEGSSEMSVFRCIWANEWDKYAASVYRRHYGEIDTRDIRDVSGDEIPEHDLLTAGFPCQAFSVAGKRGGFEDTRGTLFFEIARIAKHHQPMFLLLENVKGLISHDDGKTLETILVTLQELGYYTNYEVYNSKEYGVPQNRERTFFLCTHVKGLDGQNQKIASSKIIITEWLFQNFLNNYKEVKKLQETVSKDWVAAWLVLKGIVTAFGNKKNLRSFEIISKDLLRKSKEKFQPNLLAVSIAKPDSSAGKNTTEVEKLLIALEGYKSVSAENMWQSIDLFILNILGENSKELSKSTISTAIKQIIESKTYTYSQMFLAILLATVLLRKSSSPSWKEVLLNLIVIQEGTNYARNSVQAEDIVITESGVAHLSKNLQDFSESFSVGHLRGKCTGEIFPVGQPGEIPDFGDTRVAATLQHPGHSGGNYRGMNMIQVGHIKPEGSNYQSGRIYDTGGVAATIDGEAGGQGAKTGLYAMRGRESGQQLELRGDETNSLTSVNKDNLWLEGTRIRRLTPVECERLQDFFDNFTKFGMTEEGEIVPISDSQRYKCMGNSVTTSVITAIGSKLLEHIKECECAKANGARKVE